MGMMLETTATRLFTDPGGPHYGSPDKDPAVRLRVLDDAGRVGVPFTTGILIGIGETRTERAESLFAIRRSAREYAHIQEVIVQNFRAKPDTAMRGMPDAELHELAATVAVARLVLGPRARLQAPPNLIDAEFALLLRAGIDDWGGVSPVTPDHVNPERPWPQIDELRQRSAAAGFELRERLSRICTSRRGVAGPAVGRPRRRAVRPDHRPGRGGCGTHRAAVAGAGRRVPGGRPHRPAHRDRHRGPYRGPAR
jgi:FO synthase